MPLEQIFFWAVPIIVLASYCFLILFLFFSKKDRFIRSFMLVLFALIIWTASSLFMKLQLHPGVLFWNRIMVTATIAVPFLLYYFVSIFTHSQNRGRILLWAILTVGCIVVNWLGWVVTDASVITNPVVSNGREFSVVEFSYSMGLMAIPVYFLNFILIGVIIAKTRISVKNGNTNYGQVGLITAGLIIMALGVFLNVFPAIGKYPVDILTCLINAILITIAIYKYRMLELRLIVTKGIVFSILAAIVTVLYVYLVFFIERHLGSFNKNLTPYFQTISALVVALFFQPLYGLSRSLVDRIFYKAEYSRRQALRNFSVNLSNKLDLNDIAQELIESVKLAIHCRQIYVLLQNEDLQHYYVFAASSQLFKPNFKIAYECPLVKWFESNNSSISKDDIYIQPFFKSMWEEEKRALYEFDIEVIIPIKSRNDLIGMLMLTRKDNNTAYTLDDLDLLTYLGASTAVAFDNARLYAQAQKEALSDSLTNVNNHRYFRKSLSEWMERIGSGELSLIMLDLDLFKLYNDLHGHIEGDRALETVASIMKRIVGEKGIVCRYGGEEFTILLPYQDSRRAFELAEKIRIEIQRAFFDNNNSNKLFLTASIGVCSYPHAAPNGEELIRRADFAMYTAKNKGKNQTVIYTPSSETDDNFNKDSAEEPFYSATIYALTATIDAKDQYTFGHSQRVAEYSTVLANSMGLDKSYLEMVREAALLHDIGKIGVPENILTKTGRLTEEEYNIVKKHVDMSITIIKHLPSVNHVIPAVIGHHERWDGKGYPRGVKGDNIPLGARCLAIADAFDAMTSNRPYRASLSVDAALNEIKSGIGTHFDPEIARLFIRLVREGTIRCDQIMRRHSIVS